MYTTLFTCPSPLLLPVRTQSYISFSAPFHLVDEKWTLRRSLHLPPPSPTFFIQTHSSCSSNGSLHLIGWNTTFFHLPTPPLVPLFLLHIICTSFNWSSTHLLNQFIATFFLDVMCSYIIFAPSSSILHSCMIFILLFTFIFAFHISYALKPILELGLLHQIGGAINSCPSWIGCYSFLVGYTMFICIYIFLHDKYHTTLPPPPPSPNQSPFIAILHSSANSSFVLHPM